MKNDLVFINLDRPRFLRFGHIALKTFTAMTGTSITEIDMETFDFEKLEILMYCGLLADARTNGENLKLSDVELLLDACDEYVEVINKLGEAMSNSFGGASKGKN